MCSSRSSSGSSCSSSGSSCRSGAYFDIGSILIKQYLKSNMSSYVSNEINLIYINRINEWVDE